MEWRRREFDRLIAAAAVGGRELLGGSRNGNGTLPTQERLTGKMTYRWGNGYRAWPMAILPIVIAWGWAASPQAARDKPPDHVPTLVNTCLITSNVKRLVEFYEAVLTIKARKSGDDYAEFPTGMGVLAIFSERAQEQYIPGCRRSGDEQEHDPGIQGRRRR